MTGYLIIRVIQIFATTDRFALLDLIYSEYPVAFLHSEILVISIDNFEYINIRCCIIRVIRQFNWPHSRPAAFDINPLYVQFIQEAAQTC